MLRLIFDIETDALLDAATKCHCVWVRNADTGEMRGFADQPGYAPVSEALALLSEADVLIGHNILTFDLPVLQKLYGLVPKKGCVVRDTLVCCRVIWADIKNDDYNMLRRMPNFPTVLLGRHSLKAWGWRLGVYKGEFGGDDERVWDAWTPEMMAYCRQDVIVNAALWERIERKAWSERSLDLEHAFQRVIFEQERHGFRFSVQRATALQAKLVARREALTKELQSIFPARVEEMKTPEFWTVKNVLTGETLRGGTKGSATAAAKAAGWKPKLCEFTPGPNKKKLHQFNPASTMQIAERLMEKGWVPLEFTDTGLPVVDDEVISRLPYTEAPLLAEFLVVQKRLGQVAEGDKAWLRYVKDGRMHGRVVTNGAVTGRCTHHSPNIAQTPKASKDVPYGYECRDCFIADEGFVLVGCDASGLELRCLAHYMSRYDDGAYAKEVLEGDVHTANQKAAGLDTRNQAKTFIYAFLYGAGDEKIGTITGVTDDEIKEFKRSQKTRWNRAARMLEEQNEKLVNKGSKARIIDDRLIATVVKGGLLKQRFLDRTPALKQLREDVQAAIRYDRPGCPAGFLKGLDGRLLRIRHKHAALNTLLQSAGALAMKLATVIFRQAAEERGWVFGTHYALVAHIHDEMQIQARKDLADEVGKLAVWSIEEAGRQFGFRCPLTGEYKIGNSWAETH